MRAWVLVAVLAGCAPRGEVALDDGRTVREVVDLRREFPPAPADGLQLVTPDWLIEPYSEIEWCWFSTWSGPTVGLHAQWSFQSPHGHHVVLNATSAAPDQYPDGDVIDCTDPGAMPMTTVAPLLVGGTGNVETPDGPNGELILPEGMAVELEAGQRIVVQSHYVNTTPDPILVRDALNLDLVDPEDVVTWTAPFVHVETDLAIAPGHDELSFACTFEDDYELLFLAGHMHQHGAAFETSLTPGDGSATSSLYAVPEWDPVFRDAAPVNRYAPGEMRVRAGDTFTTRCQWENETGHVVGFPEEMCLTFGMAYPLDVPIVCDPP